MPIGDKHLFVPSKMEYANDINRPNVECILCSIIKQEKDNAVVNLEVYRSSLFVISLNLYPYNPGHLLIFPIRHITDLRQLINEEILELNNLTNLSLNVLDVLYSPGGYNIGYNIGHCSGASIEHLHLHIVPRYEKEIGFVDIVAGAKIMVEDPQITLSRVSEQFKNMN